MEKAVTDLLWLSQRLSGILELKDILSTYASLENNVKELEKASEGLRKDVRALEDKKANLNTDISDVLLSIQERSDKAKEEARILLSNAEAKYHERLSQAEKAADALIEQADAKVLDINEKLNVKQQEYIKLNNEASLADNRIKQIKADLEALKGKL